MQLPLKSPTSVLSPLAEAWLLRLIVILFVVFALLPYGISWDYTGTSSLTMEGSLAVKLEWGSLFAVSGFLLYQYPALAIRNLKALNPFLILILLWCLGSFIWSPMPGVTFKRAIQLYGFVAIGLALQISDHPVRLIVSSMLYTLMVMLAASFVMGIVNPTIGIDYELGGAWRGILSQKNELGQVAAMSILLWQVLACISKVNVRIMAVSLIFAFLMLVLSKSSTSMIVTITTSSIFHLLRKPRIDSEYAVTRVLLSLLCLILVALFVFFMQESRLPTSAEVTAPIAGLFGKASDLTGRTDIWELVWLEIRRHWAMGLGYGAFWLGPDSLSQYVIDALHWIPLQSHNGYLDILNEQGLVGLTLTVLVILYHAYSLLLMRRTDQTQAAFWTAMLLVIVVTNFTESSLFRGFGFLNVFFFIAMCTVTSHNRAQRDKAIQDFRNLRPVRKPGFSTQR